MKKRTLILCVMVIIILVIGIVFLVQCKDRFFNTNRESLNTINNGKAIGKYCDEGYTLEDNWCIKEIDRVPASSGKVCPKGYYEREENCYETSEIIESDKYFCEDGYKLEDNKCAKIISYNATGKCDNGEYVNGYCVEQKYIGDAHESCEYSSNGVLLKKGKCYSGIPTIDGTCRGSGILINGYCYDFASGSNSYWFCSDGTLNNDNKKCYKESKEKPSSYYCENNDLLNGTKCEKKQILEAKREKKCSDGYTLILNNVCINYNKTSDKENGFVCSQSNSKLSGKECIIYEKIEAHDKN